MLCSGLVFCVGLELNEGFVIFPGLAPGIGFELWYAFPGLAF